jgi:hypothetical protein
VENACLEPIDIFINLYQIILQKKLRQKTPLWRKIIGWSCLIGGYYELEHKIKIYSNLKFQGWQLTLIKIIKITKHLEGNFF